MKKIGFVFLVMIVIAFGKVEIEDNKKNEVNTKVELQSKVSLDGLRLGMKKDEVFKIKFPNNSPKLSSLSYIEKIYYRDTGKNLENDFYIYEAKIADEMAYIWIWFTKETNELYAMRVEWRNKQDIYNIGKDVHKILTRKYGKPNRKTWKLGDIKIIEKLERVSIDNTYFRNYICFTYIDTKLQKKHNDSIVPYKRPENGL
jgi:hypothetical protein